MLNTAYKSMMLGGLFFKEVQNDTCIKKSSLYCRRSELPVYIDEAPKEPPSKEPQERDVNDTELHGHIERNVRIFRHKARCQLESFKARNAAWMAYFDEAVTRTQSTINYLREPQNTIPRCGAIMLGGATGFLCAIRGGPMKRFVYTAIGAGALASFCYPREACDQAKVALHESRKVFAVAYDYIKHKKMDNEIVDPEPMEQNNKFPMTLDDWRHFLKEFFTTKKDEVPKQVDE